MRQEYRLQIRALAGLLKTDVDHASGAAPVWLTTLRPERQMPKVIVTRLLAASVAAAFLASIATATVAQAETCTRPAEKAAFDVVGLKSELMVTAIACQAQDKYNVFVVRFRRDLVSLERVLTSYFARTAGRHATQEHDDYITSLANSESQDGITRGVLFCNEHLSMFDDVMALKDGAALQTYAAGKVLAQPIALVVCPLPPPKKLKKVAAADTK
jgi:hypothetical protein